MARAATTTDAFNAVAEPRRREILDLLARGELAVNDIVDRLGVAQPLVSKHLRVLREVGLVDVRDEGRRRLYRLNPVPLRPIHDWVRGFEQLWSERFDRMDVVLAELMEQEHRETGRAAGTPATEGDSDGRQHRSGEHPHRDGDVAG
ncbi:ArsR/SmtB family transcription factor [Pseudonocardia sp.]|uniref:ArsR/SmtB family transcription factor n=1 Tax=Pseudonocardia sp. TaxID=60912 RepID=UPI003D12FE44